MLYDLLIRLDYIEQRIWRRIRVPETLTLAKLDCVIQTAMGWTNSHLHEFEISGKRYGVKLDGGWSSDKELLEDQHFTVGDVLGHAITSFRYTYDFGDNWKHTVLIERRLQSDESIDAAPVCTGGERACPPEDVGGIGGYQEFLEAMADPEHEEHTDMWDWNGGPFDPEKFELNVVNDALGRLT
jgi:hypothetical protein